MRALSSRPIAPNNDIASSSRPPSTARQHVNIVGPHPNSGSRFTLSIVASPCRSTRPRMVNASPNDPFAATVIARKAASSNAIDRWPHMDERRAMRTRRF